MGNERMAEPAIEEKSTVDEVSSDLSSHDFRQGYALDASRNEGTLKTTSDGKTIL